MLVRVDHVADRLARRELAHLVDHGTGAPFVQRRLDEDQVILHLDRDAVVRAAADEPDAVGHLVHGDALGCGAHELGHLDVGRRVRLDLAHGEVEHRKAALRLPDAASETARRRSRDSRVGRDARGVAEHRIRRARLDALDERRPSSTKTVALKRPGSVNATVGEAGLRVRATVALFLIAAFTTPCGVIHSWWTRSATKRGPGRGAVGELVPGMAAAHVLVVALLAGVRIAAAAQRFARATARSGRASSRCRS